MSCIICNSNNQKLLFKDVLDLEYSTYKPVSYILCKNCNLISQDPVPPKSLIKTFYPEDYRNYLPINDSFFSLLKRIQFTNLAAKISKYINKDSKILEIGCGNGELLLASQKKGFSKLYGCDFTHENLKTLIENKINVQACDIEKDFPFNEPFDLIIMNNVIEHFINPEKVLINCKNNLQENGKIILITPNSNALEFSIFKKYWAGLHSPRHTFIFNSANIQMLAKKSGFTKIEIKPITDAGQWSISIQNLLQSTNITKTKLKNGLAFYALPISLVFAPIALFQNVIGKSTSMMCVMGD